MAPACDFVSDQERNHESESTAFESESFWYCNEPDMARSAPDIAVPQAIIYPQDPTSVRDASEIISRARD